MNFSSLQSSVQKFGMNQALKYLEKDPETNIPKLMNLVDKVMPEGWYGSQRKLIREQIDEKGVWYDYILKLYDLDADVRQTVFKNFIFNASLNGSTKQEELSEKYNCNIPWAVLLDPTSACNLHCTGCWAAEYGQICEMHPDCAFLSFTNGTLIDEEFCQDMLRVKNFVPAISLEGFETANDSRRGEGCYENVKRAMELLKKHKLPFGISTCYTSANYKDIASDEFFDLMIDSGALFCWFFHYMPVGNGAVKELLPTPEQRAYVYHQIRKFRSEKPIFTMDFQNDAQYVGGCIAGGRRYLHINAKGDVEPCVFIHYSNCNIHDTTLLDALRSPLFQAYHDNQPFNENMLRPCPMLENAGRIQELVKQSKAVNTDYESPEDVDHLLEKPVPYAKNWKPMADKLWNEQKK